MAILLYKWFLALFLTGMSSAAECSKNYEKTAHPFFISVTEISHDALNKNLEISCKIFTDDFETALLKSGGSRIDFYHTKNKQEADKQIAAYIKKHLLIKLDNKPVVLEFIGYERENEAVWSYLQVSNTALPRKIEITNDLLYESFQEQINLIHVSVGNNRKSTKLNFPETSTSFQF